MIQLGYFATQPQNQDESLDFDPNYDPSDFLMKKDPSEPEPMVQDQPQYQEPYDYAQGGMQEPTETDDLQQQNYYGSFAQQSFNVSDFGFQQPQMIAQDDFSQPQLQQQQLMAPSDGGGLADLEISDSDDDDNNEDESGQQNQAETSKEDEENGSLWF